MKMKKKKIKKAPVIIVVVLVLIIAIRLFSCGNAETAALVNTAQPIRGDVEESISTSGIVASEVEKTYFARVSGALGGVHVEAGDAVKEGDILVSYDMEQMDRSLKEASLQQTASTSTYNSTLSDNNKGQSQLQEAETNLAVLDQQIKDYNNYLKSLKEKLSSSQRDTSNALAEESMNLSGRSAQLQQELENLDKKAADYAQKAAQLSKQLQEVTTAQSRNQYLQKVADSSDYVLKLEKEIEEVSQQLKECEEYKAEMESQKAASEKSILDSYQREQYEANNELALLSYQQSEADYYTAKQGITADFDGIILECSAVEGAVVSGGLELLTLADSNQIKVTFSVSKYDLERLAVGQTADVTILGSIYTGEISKINRMAVMNSSGTPMVDAELRITNPDEKIILGLDAKILIHTAKSQNAVLVPVEAINADREGDFLYAVENNLVVRKQVVCGLSSDTYVEILEGITEEDQIILYSYSDLEEGMAVTAMPTQ